MFSLKPILPKTLFGRSLLIIVIPALLLQLIATYIFYDRHWDRMADQLAGGLVGEIEFILDRIESQPVLSEESLDTVATLSARYFNIILSFDADKASLETNQLEGLRAKIAVKSLKKHLKLKLDKEFSLNVADNDKWVSVSVLTDAGVTTFTVAQRRVFNSSSYIFVLWMMAISIALFSIAIIFMRNQIRPIRRLSIAADWFGKGRDVARFKPEGALEVRQAGNAFLTMRDRIKRQISQRTEMLAGVSHDLRTPLTRLKLELEMLDEKQAKPMAADIAEMEKMIEGYLDFVRTEGQEEAEFTQIRTIIDKVLADAIRQNIVIETDFDPSAKDTMVWLRVNGFARALMNILQNAHHYAKAIKVSTRLALKEGEYSVMIEDNGAGIPVDQREDVFRPFYRVEASRNKKTGGVGLGLSIAQDVVHSHGGTITLDDSTMGGLKVIISLPL
jgi:two-component system osmolarity sensor histidine kinase EnvZ